MPKDTKTLGNNKARACESLGFVHKKRLCQRFDTTSFIFRSKKKNLFHLSYSQNIHAILSISGNPPVRISISAMDSITRIISEPVRSVRYP